MGRRCTICYHPERGSIEAELVSGTPYRQIAERYGVSTTAISRHIAHAASSVRAAIQAANVEHGGSILARLKALNERAQGLLEAAASEGAYSAVAAILRELRELLALEARLIGELEDEKATVNIDARTLAIHIAKALEPYPEAASAASSAVMEVLSGKRG